ncbi:MAG TPA: FKBP-type peptidyl-prolyl cis-trans isomerase [Prolixibacteraceae bacterium]|nr:FKBP-type peptidyl-prolyl cis-trans isomerase [Prolixibacteraceae bacterium]HPS13497.1 FKBP-type peptidyl-prolyl cis-trans isomerase [Prolixibacteraceae bacterium]
MNISVNKMVTLSYVLRAEGKDGKVIEQTTEEYPLQFVYGIGQMLPAFESNLTGLKQGDDFEMTLTADEAYGEVDPEAVVDLPKDLFIIDGQFDEERFYTGAIVPMQASNGQRMNGTVVDIKEDVLVMNFNHPLAGVNLHFTGNIIEVREATEDELMPSCGCGCDSDSCNSDSCGSGSCGC